MSGKIVVITGASSGIGAELARQLAGRGEKVVLAARRKSELQQVATECGSEALAVVTDVTQRSEVVRLRDEALHAFGGIDVWVNNAGRGISRSVLELSDDDFEAMMAINVKAALYGMQAVIPHFKERRAGHLINVSSALGRIPFASNRSVYSAAKAALNSLTANLRMDLRKEFPAIRVSLVIPPLVTTDFANHALHGTPLPAGGFRSAAGAQSPQQVAAAMAALIDQPQAELYTNPAQKEMVAEYYGDVEGFEANLGR